MKELPNNTGTLNRYLALSWVAIAAIGVIIVGMVGYFFFIDLDGPPKILLPDSAILQPVLDSAEGKAFTARYPDYTSTVLQDFYGMNAFVSRYPCCTVELFHGADDKAIILHANVSASSDLKTISVDDTAIECLVSDGVGWGGWMLKEDVVENLRPGEPECWESPPPTPSDQDLIAIASNTTVGKAYLSRYPENNFIIERLNPFYDHTKVTFTPKISEPIEYVIKFGGLEWQIVEAYIVCSHGDYLYPDSPNFWSSLEPGGDCLQSVHDKLVVANETEQAKAFQEKYAGVGLHLRDHSGRFTVTGTESTIKYLWTEPLGDEAILIVRFKPGTTEIGNFEIQCGEEASSAGVPLHQSRSGMDLNVAEFLEDINCPSYQPAEQHGY